MKKPYTVKYRQKGQWLWRTIKNVVGDAVEPGLFRWVLTADDRLIYFGLDAEVIFPAGRQEAKRMDMSKEAGTPVMRA